jgi:hypothetical protein
MKQVKISEIVLVGSRHARWAMAIAALSQDVSGKHGIGVRLARRRLV